MNKKTTQVFIGFLNLTDQEKNELIDQINRYQEGNSIVRKSLKETFRLELGPVSSSNCPCCGK